ncbi:unnamed protein product [Rotaria sp. Silwood2]|nr:unnamed protein product [Rotaria sp. Silwood2]
MVDCLSWHSCYGSLRSSKFYSKEKRFISKKHADQQYCIQKQVQNNINNKSNCVTSDTRSLKKQRNINYNNNISPQETDEQNSLLQFYIFDVSRERNLHLSTCSNDKRLLIFSNISNGLHKMGVRNGELLDLVLF